MAEPSAESIAAKLFRAGDKQPTDKAPGQFEEHLLEQYRLYVEMADRISARRQTANSFFLTINTALLAVFSYVGLGASSEMPVGRALLAAAGIVLCYAWFRLIRSYRDLNTAKFKVIHQIEKRLPASPYDAEWEAVGRGERPDLYLPFTKIEVGIPWVFLVLHVVVLLQAIPWQALAGAA